MDSALIVASRDRPFIKNFAKPIIIIQTDHICMFLTWKRSLLKTDFQIILKENYIFRNKSRFHF